MRTHVITIALAGLIAAIAALTSPARAEQVACDSAEGHETMVGTLPQAGDDHPVHVTFRTDAKGAELPRRLLTQYPHEMTVILQYEFERLVVTNERIAVNLWFKGRPARVVIPFASVTAFFDRSVARCRGG